VFPTAFRLQFVLTVTPAFILILSAICPAAARGSFRGRIANTSVENRRQWIYVEAGRRNVRRVDVSRATIRFGENVAPNRRTPHPADSLARGAEVEVIAAQDDSGEWRASSVRILELASEQQRN
jgi:hypothetical protein